MTILVTGSTGLLGTAVVERLCALEVPRIRCFVRPNSDTSCLREIQSRYPPTQFQYVVGNLLSSKDACDATEGVNTVIHLAAEMRGLPPTVFANTVVASKNILEGIVRHRVRRVILASSICVYGLASRAHGTVVTEESKLEERPEARDIYTFSKVRQDQLFHEYRKTHSFELITLRPGIIYGGNSKSWPSRAGLRIGRLVLEIAGRNQLPLTHVTSCATAVALTATQNNAREGCYNVVDDDLPTVAEYVRLRNTVRKPLVRLRMPFWLALPFSFILEHLHNASCQQIPLLLNAYRLRSLWGGHVFSNQKLRAIGWRPTVSAREGVSRCFRQPAPTLGAGPSTSWFHHGIPVEDPEN